MREHVNLSITNENFIATKKTVNATKTSTVIIGFDDWLHSPIAFNRFKPSACRFAFAIRSGYYAFVQKVKCPQILRRISGFVREIIITDSAYSYNRRVPESWYQSETCSDQPFSYLESKIFLQLWHNAH